MKNTKKKADAIFTSIVKSKESREYRKTKTEEGAEVNVTQEGQVKKKRRKIILWTIQNTMYRKAGQIDVYMTISGRLDDRN